MIIFIFLLWVVAGFYFYSRWHKHLENKGIKNKAVYITRNVCLKVHPDGVIYSLYKGKTEIADDILEHHNGFMKTTFKTIFGTITLNRITKKIEIDEKRGV